MARYQPRHRRSNRLIRFLLGTGLFIACALAGVIIFRTSLIEMALTSAINQQGLGPAKINVVRADWSSLTLDTGSIAGGALTFSTLEAQYALTSLRAERITHLRLINLSIAGDWTAAGLSFGGLDQLIGQRRSGITDSAGTDSPRDTSLLPVDNIEIGNATLTINHPDGEIFVTANMQFALAGTSIDTNANIALSGPGLAGTFGLHGTLTSEDFRQSSLEGKLGLTASRFVIPGADEVLSADMELKATADKGTLSISAERELTLSGPWPADLPLFAGNAATDQTFDAALKSQTRSTPFFNLTSSDEGMRAVIDFDLSWATPFGRGALTTSGWATLGKDNLPQDFKFERLEIQIDGAPTPFGTLWAKLSGDGLRGPLAVAEGPVKLTGRLLDGSVQGVSAREVDLNLDTIFRLDGLSLAFAINDLGARVQGFRAGDSIETNEPVEIGLSALSQATQTAALVYGADGSATITFDTALSALVPQTTLITENSSLSFNAALPAVWLQGYWVSTDGSADIQAIVQDGLWASDLATLSNINLDLSGGLTDLAGTLTAVIERKSAASSKSTRLPLQSNMLISYNSVLFDGVVGLSSSNKLGEFELSYSFESQAGRIRALTGPLVFGGEQGLSPSDLKPLGLPFTPIAGEFAAKVEMSFGGASDGPQTGALYFKDIELDSEYYRVTMLNAAVEFDSIMPLKTRGPQKAAVGLLQAGLPVTDLLMSFSISSPEKMEIEDLTMAFAGGRLSGGPMSLWLDGRETRATLTVADVNLPDVARLSGLIGLDAIGTLSGRIPIRMKAGDVLIEAGILNTDGPGSIRYLPDPATSSMASSQSGMTLAMQALENFQYESIKVTVSGSVKQELEADLAIKGRNPSLYGGYPIDFNLNLSGELANIIRSSMTGYRVPETIKRQLMAFPPGR
jgi:hypothetical protein